MSRSRAMCLLLFSWRPDTLPSFQLPGTKDAAKVPLLHRPIRQRTFPWSWLIPPWNSARHCVPWHKRDCKKIITLLDVIVLLPVRYWCNETRIEGLTGFRAIMPGIRRRTEGTHSSVILINEPRMVGDVVYLRFQVTNCVSKRTPIALFHSLNDCDCLWGDTDISGTPSFHVHSMSCYILLQGRHSHGRRCVTWIKAIFTRWH